MTDKRQLELMPEGRADTKKNDALDSRHSVELIGDENLRKRASFIKSILHVFKLSEQNANPGHAQTAESAQRFLNQNRKEPVDDLTRLSERLPTDSEYKMFMSKMKYLRSRVEEQMKKDEKVTKDDESLRREIQLKKGSLSMMLNTGGVEKGLLYIRYSNHDQTTLLDVANTTKIWSDGSFSVDRTSFDYDTGEEIRRRYKVTSDHQDRTVHKTTASAIAQSEQILDLYLSEPGIQNS